MPRFAIFGSSLRSLGACRLFTPQKTAADKTVDGQRAGVSLAARPKKRGQAKPCQGSRKRPAAPQRETREGEGGTAPGGNGAAALPTYDAARRPMTRERTPTCGEQRKQRRPLSRPAQPTTERLDQNLAQAAAAAAAPSRRCM
ncbi:hypothetical protein HPB50_022636 [Hyalomma asiaticum]|uniref:Uncharacterized protein n=1 Tax=Hyalomma asiaticum TaxID=266040 RepID=A0ACB7RV97_HYAAI|nr:hypothetical protein HPB50_022636 [Hyalomma asiaticum]